jgi:hypothetical protein
MHVYVRVNIYLVSICSVWNIFHDALCITTQKLVPFQFCQSKKWGRDGLLYEKQGMI